LAYLEHLPLPEQDASDNKLKPAIAPEQHALKSPDADEVANPSATNLSAVDEANNKNFFWWSKNV
jgi:hypothetical protein